MQTFTTVMVLTCIPNQRSGYAAEVHIFIDLFLEIDTKGAGTSKKNQGRLNIGDSIGEPGWAFANSKLAAALWGCRFANSG